MTHKTKTPLALAIGTAFAASLATSSIATAAPSSSNPFAMSELSSGYMQVADNHMKEGKCGGAKEMEKNMEGKCGGAKSSKEGKCGEGKCGGKK